MTTEEVVALAKTFVKKGVNKIRITGGEPLIKKDIENILTQLSALPVNLSLTTNGILIDRHIELFQKIGLKDINISIDSLNEERFDAITKRKYFKRVLDNIHLAIEKGLNVKLNVVLMKGINDDEVIDFIELTKAWPVAIRFIEFMPFDGNRWETDKVVSYAEIMDQVQNKYDFADVKPVAGHINDTAKNFKINQYKGSFGIIASVTNPFCDGCNRLRLTADGKLKNCLFSNEETDLLTPFRLGQSIDKLIQTSIMAKHEKRGGIDDFTDQNIAFFEANRNMTSIGG